MNRKPTTQQQFRYRTDHGYGVYTVTTVYPEATGDQDQQTRQIYYQPYWGDLKPWHNATADAHKHIDRLTHCLGLAMATAAELAMYAAVTAQDLTDAEQLAYRGVRVVSARWPRHTEYARRDVATRRRRARETAAQVRDEAHPFAIAPRQMFQYTVTIADSQRHEADPDEDTSYTYIVDTPGTLRQATALVMARHTAACDDPDVIAIAGRTF